ncbi:hypothetical protein FD725_10985 [Nostoc sp. TCL26-01]|nr:hypothetical protein FD725_10985 [Nostoc sp. TCL26-01]
MMFFEQIEVGAYFHIPGISSACVYRKACSSQCSLNSLLQPIRANTQVVLLSEREVKAFLAAKQDYLKSLVSL